MPRTDDALRAHCMEVVLCENARAVLSKPLPKLSPDELKCATVARSQLLAASRKKGLDSRLKWLVPEPWNGHLRTAPLLFIGQNPSADHHEDYPTGWHVASGSANDELLQFFEGRFDSGNSVPHIKDGTKVRLRNGGHANEPNKFLAHVNRLAVACLGHPATAGTDYVITDAVRCKAARAPGIHLATSVCAGKFLLKTLELSPATVLICLGGEARTALTTVAVTMDQTDKRQKLPLNMPFKWGNRHVLCLEHCDARNANEENSIELANKLRQYLPGPH